MTQENSPQIKAPTVVIEKQSEKLRPPIPFESRFGLSPELASMNQRSIPVEQVHVLPSVSVRYPSF